MTKQGQEQEQGQGLGQVKQTNRGTKQGQG